jgi:hypothetical protein
MLTKAVEALETAGYRMKDLVDLTRLSEATLNMILGVERDEAPSIGVQLGEDLH